MVGELNYFSINDKGHVIVTPQRNGMSVDLKDLLDETYSFRCVNSGTGQVS